MKVWRRPCGGERLSASKSFFFLKKSIKIINDPIKTIEIEFNLEQLNGKGQITHKINDFIRLIEGNYDNQSLILVQLK